MCNPSKGAYSIRSRMGRHTTVTLVSTWHVRHGLRASEMSEMEAVNLAPAWLWEYFKQPMRYIIRETQVQISPPKLTPP